MSTLFPTSPTGVDLLRSQILYAFGAPITVKQEDIEFRGHSIEARITNLDPYSEAYGPMGGKTIERYLPPKRTDRMRHYGYVNNDDKLTSFDPMFAKVLGRGHDRQEAVEALFGYDASLSLLWGPLSVTIFLTSSL